MDAGKIKIGIILSEFNAFVGEKLLKGCLEGLSKLEFEKESFSIVKVPGAFEIPLRAKQMTEEGFEVLIALGCVIKGDTYHFDHICRACADGIMQVQIQTGVPIVFEVLMVETLEDALKRASDKLEENKGYVAAMVAGDLLRIKQKKIS